MAAFQIPLTPQPQRFAIQLAGVTYNLTIHWCGPAGDGTWVLDIADSENAPLVQGIPLVTGADLLAQYAYLGFGGELWVQSDDQTFRMPTYLDLGTLSHLYFVTVD